MTKMDVEEAIISILSLLSDVEMRAVSEMTATLRRLITVTEDDQHLTVHLTYI